MKYDMNNHDLDAALEGILFASGDPIPAGRIADAMGVNTEAVLHCAGRLAEYYTAGGRGIRLVRMEDRLQLTSAPELADKISAVLETRRPPKLSGAALEVLTIAAYYQPVTRAYIDKLRGVDSAYTVGLLADRGLIAATGRLDAPGRPLLYETTDVFLRVMGIASLSELPKLPDIETDEGIRELRAIIDNMEAGSRDLEPEDGQGGGVS